MVVGPFQLSKTMYVYQFYEHEFNLCQLCRIFLPLELAILFPWVQGPLLTELSFLLDFIFFVVYFITMAKIDIFQVDVFQEGKSLSNSKIDKTGLCTCKRIQTIHMTVWYTHQNYT